MIKNVIEKGDLSITFLIVSKYHNTFFRHYNPNWSEVIGLSLWDFNFFQINFNLSSTSRLVPQLWFTNGKEQIIWQIE